MKVQVLALALLLVLACAVWASAQAVAGVAHLSAPWSAEAAAHSTAVVTLHVSVDPGYHIQSNHPKLDYLIPSRITLVPAGGIAVTSVVWPKPKEHTFGFAPNAPLPVFEGTIAVAVTLKTAAPGDTLLHGAFSYQACNDQLCRPPVTVPFTLALHVR